MTQEEKHELARLVHKLCNEDGWKMYFQNVRIPLNEGGEVYVEGDAQEVKEHLENHLMLDLRDWLTEKDVEIED